MHRLACHPFVCFLPYADQHVPKKWRNKKCRRPGNLHFGLWIRWAHDLWRHESTQRCRLTLEDPSNDIDETEYKHVNNNHLFDCTPLPPPTDKTVDTQTVGEGLSYLSLNWDPSVFGSDHLTGTIPSEVGLLKSLAALFLGENDLTGTIPSEVGLLKSLEVLFLGESDLTGTIPTEIGLLVSLFHIKLYGNGLTGVIPSELGSLTSLALLYLNENKLTGSIPSELGGLVMCYDMDLSNNLLTGPIPQDLCNVGMLSGSDTFLIITGNNVVGALQGNDTCAVVISVAPVEWPGLFPAVDATQELIINIQFDGYPNETSWLFQEGLSGECNLTQEVSSGAWKNVSEGTGDVPQGWVVVV